MADIVGRVTGCEVEKRRIPLAVMRASSPVLRRIKPALARQIYTGVVMDTGHLALDATAVRERFGSIAMITFEDVVRAEIVPGA